VESVVKFIKEFLDDIFNLGGFDFNEPRPRVGGVPNKSKVVKQECEDLRDLNELIDKAELKMEEELRYKDRAKRIRDCHEELKNLLETLYFESKKIDWYYNGDTLNIDRRWHSFGCQYIITIGEEGDKGTAWIKCRDAHCDFNYTDSLDEDLIFCEVGNSFVEDVLEFVNNLFYGKSTEAFTKAYYILKSKLDSYDRFIISNDSKPLISSCGTYSMYQDSSAIFVRTLKMDATGFEIPFTSEIHAESFRYRYVKIKDYDWVNQDWHSWEDSPHKERWWEARTNIDVVKRKQEWLGVVSHMQDLFKSLDKFNEVARRSGTPCFGQIHNFETYCTYLRYCGKARTAKAQLLVEQYLKEKDLFIE